MLIKNNKEKNDKEKNDKEKNDKEKNDKEKKRTALGLSNLFAFFEILK
jgi:hypothetical protein